MTDSKKRDQWPSVSFTRIGLLVGTPLAVLFGAQISHAITLKQWAGGETLTAADLNTNFGAVNTELARVGACPADSVRVVDTNLGSFCITKIAKPEESSYDANADCVSGVGRLCTSAEYQAAYTSGLLTAATDPQGEWGSFIGFYAGTYGDGAGCTGPSMWSYDFANAAGGGTKLDCVDADRSAANIVCGTTPTACAQYRCCR